MSAPGAIERESLDRLLRDMRPKLHRYLARMTGSVIDGEDALQDAYVKVVEAIPRAGPITNPEAWVFQVAHNAALDFLRRRARREAWHTDEDPDMAVDPSDSTEGRQIVAASIRTFMRLPVAQRSSVILKDVLGYSLEELSEVMQASLPTVKAALHRGRIRLRALAEEPGDTPVPAMSNAERERLAGYVDRFNARDFGAIKSMLAEDVRLELVNRTRMRGRREVANYFGNYDGKADWRLEPGFVEDRPAVLVSDPQSAAGVPAYFVLLEWAGERVAGIRDFRYARYAALDARLTVLAR